MRRVLVTGATGFVGQAVVPGLEARGLAVRAAVRGPGATDCRAAGGREVVVCGDLERDVDWSSLVDGVDGVVHLAGIAHANGVTESRYDAVNRRATRELARAAASAGVSRFVFVSSIKAQSSASSDRVVTEDDPPRPDDAYGRSKLAAELEIAEAGVPHTILRPVVIYGPGVKGNLRSLWRLADTPLPLPLGGLTNRRSLLSMDNLIEGIVFGLLAPEARDRTFVIADPTPVTLPAIVAALRAGVGRPPRLVPIPAPWLAAVFRGAGREAAWSRIGGALVVDPGKLVRAGWVPPVDTLRALEDLAVSWRRETVRAG